MKYYEVFGEPGYHSAFLTTFSFSAQAFEDIVFSKLRGAGCRNVVVLADQSMVNVDAEEFGVPRYAGALYHLVKVNVAGAFHPKITLMLGKDRGRLLVGSANLTALGVAGNRELVADLRYSREELELAPLFIQAFDYICSHAPGGDPWFPIARDRALQLSPWLKDREGAGKHGIADGLKLLHERPEQSILDQIVDAIGQDAIKRLVVMSPYWDNNLEALGQLRAALGSPPVDLLIEKSRGEFPAQPLTRLGGIELFDIEKEGGNRFNHAKLVVASGSSWDHVFSGSMNCSAPAMLGAGATLGNAEAGIYKRVECGSALEALGLGGYRDAPINPALLAPNEQSEMRTEGATLSEAGSFYLQGNFLTWAPPARLREQPVSVQLCDATGGSPWENLPIDETGNSSWCIERDLALPRSAKLHFANGGTSSPAIVVDLDCLHSKTLPASGGKRSKLADRLLNTTSEDLALVGIISDLEALDLDELGIASKQFRGEQVKSADRADEGNHRALSYNDFVEARKRAEVRGEAFRSASVNRGSRAADLVSACLNRLIGLVSQDRPALKEVELEVEYARDLIPTEPSGDAGDAEQAESKASTQAPEATTKQTQSKLRAAKVLEAVVAFEKRSQALKGKHISTAELVRLRALLQVILAYAKPLQSGDEEHGVLPAADNSGYDWPRLVGRLLNQHFGAAIALQGLDLEQDENEQLRVIEYFATVYFAAQAAREVVKAHPRSDVLQKPLERIAGTISSQIDLVLSWSVDDHEYFHQALDKLEQRFSGRLGIATVQRFTHSDKARAMH